MKTLSTTPITNSAQYRVKKGTFDFLQDSHKETVAATIIALIGPAYSSSVVYVLYGCINSGTYPVYTITSGAVFYNGEVYYVDAASFTATGVNVAVFSVVTTQYTTNADPVTLTDTTVVNIHNIRKMLIAQGAAGSTLANYSQAFFLNFTIPEQVNLTGTGQAVVSGSYPNINVDVPASTNLNPALASGSVNFGDVASGGSDFTVTFGTALATSNYIVMGSLVSNGTPESDSTIIWTIRSRTTSGFIVHAREDAAVAQNVAWEWIAFAK